MDARARKNRRPWTRDSVVGKTVLFDIFEPLFIKDALEAPGHLNELVFGDTWWKEHSQNSVSTESVKTIRKMYQGASSSAISIGQSSDAIPGLPAGASLISKRQLLFERWSHINHVLYEPDNLFPAEKLRRKITTTTVQISSHTVWTIYPNVTEWSNIAVLG
jgi:hypothetical protein